MMEVEFRAYFKKEKYMMYNVQNIYDSQGLNEKETDITISNGISSFANFLDNDYHDTNNWALMQYIGIKDILNRKVFEGDIVRVERQIYTDCSREEIERIDEFVGEIVNRQYSWCVAKKLKDGIRYYPQWTWNIKDDELDLDTDFMEILGNRWDNPEMAVIKE